MDFKKTAVASLVLNAGLVAVASFLYVDGNSQKALIEDITKERDEAIGNATETQAELKKLQGKLSLMGTEASADDSAKLKASIDEKDAEISRLKAQLERGGNRPPNGDRRPGGGFGGGNPQEMMERLKEQNPELYERMVAERERMQKEREERQSNRERLIGAIDTSKLTDKQRETLDKYQSLVKENESLQAAMQNGDRQGFGKMMQNMGMINSYLSGELRDILIEQYVNNIRKGSGAEAAEEIKTIISATSSGFGGGPGFGGPGFGGGRGGRGGRGGFGGNGNGGRR